MNEGITAGITLLHQASRVTKRVDEDRLTFGEAGSSSEAERWHGTVRSREYRRRKNARAADAHHSGGTQTGHQTDRAGAQPCPLSVLSGALKIHQV